jgi:hypothetical protein
MPFIRADVEIYDEFVSELDPEDPPPRPSGEFEYEHAAAEFDPEKLGRVARWTLDALLAAGVTEFHVRYDGGYDEGFAHPDAVRIGGYLKSAEEARDVLATPARVAELRGVVGKDSVWGNAAELYARASDREAIGYALDELAFELSSRLLGDGFGTGEYQLYGAFTANLETGEIVDHEDAAKPADME